MKVAHHHSSTHPPKSMEQECSTLLVLRPEHEFSKTPCNFFLGKGLGSGSLLETELPAVSEFGNRNVNEAQRHTYVTQIKPKLQGPSLAPITYRTLRGAPRLSIHPFRRGLTRMWTHCFSLVAKDQTVFPGGLCAEHSWAPSLTQLPGEPPNHWRCHFLRKCSSVVYL